jgi:hypothetical protein
MYLLKNKNFGSAFIKINSKSDEESVLVTRALDSFKELFEGLIPIEIYATLKKKIEQFSVKEETQGV